MGVTVGAQVAHLKKSGGTQLPVIMEHCLSLEGVGARSSSKAALQTPAVAQTTPDVGVGAVTMYSEPEHCPADAQMRMCVLVAGVKTYSVDEQEGWAGHTRLLMCIPRACENTGAADSNSTLATAHMVRAAQDQSEVTDAAVVRYWVLEQ